MGTKHSKNIEKQKLFCKNCCVLIDSDDLCDVRKFGSVQVKVCTRCSFPVEISELFNRHETTLKINNQDNKKKNGNDSYALLDEKDIDLQVDDKKDEEYDINENGHYYYDNFDLPKIPIEYVHILPFQETININEEADNNEDDDKKNDEKDDDKYDESGLKKILSNYFSKNKRNCIGGTKFEIDDIMFKVISCYPPIGVITKDTKFNTHGKWLTFEDLKQVHILPTAESIVSNIKSGHIEEKDLFTQYYKPYFVDGSSDRHLVNGETFQCNGLEFRVIATADGESGVVSKDTVIYANGKPIEDIKKIHLLPIYETLPNRHKDLDEKQRIEIYLRPFFLGRNIFIQDGSEIDIDGVQFLVKSQPSSGIVSQNSVIFADGPPLRADDLKIQQMRDDEELARRMQRQESGLSFGMPGIDHDNSMALIQRTLGINNPSEQERMLMRLVSQHMGQIMSGVDGQGRLRVIAEPERKVNGTPPHIIKRLPRRKYQSKKKPKEESKQDEEDVPDDKTSCRICLEGYEQDEEIVTLPCFHFYHSNCIDKWLERSTKCPLCKTSVV